MLLRQYVCCALPLAFAKTGKSIAARIAMIEMTTNSSISVKPPTGCERSALDDLERILGLFNGNAAMPAQGDPTMRKKAAPGAIATLALRELVGPPLLLQFKS